MPVHLVSFYDKANFISQWIYLNISNNGKKKWNRVKKYILHNIFISKLHNIENSVIEVLFVVVMKKAVELHPIKNYLKIIQFNSSEVMKIAEHIIFLLHQIFGQDLPITMWQKVSISCFVRPRSLIMKSFYWEGWN